MKTTFKQLTGMVALATVFAFSGCNKHQVTPDKPHQTTDNSKRIHCSPWEDVADCNDAVTDLNTVAACNASTCDGNITDFPTRPGDYIRDSGGSIMYYLPFSTVTIADQNYIWSYAVNWAITNKPTGYFVSQINFATQSTTIPGSGGLLANTITFDVLYRKCTGGGGGND